MTEYEKYLAQFGEDAEQKQDEKPAEPESKPNEKVPDSETAKGDMPYCDDFKNFLVKRGFK